jgi:hypothetical protein
MREGREYRGAYLHAENLATLFKIYLEKETHISATSLLLLLLLLCELLSY